jgi:hypothetical protein
MEPMKGTGMKDDSSDIFTTKQTYGVVPGVFSRSEDLELALEEIRNLRISEADIGVAVPEPGKYLIPGVADELHEEVVLIEKGAAVGSAIGLAGIALAAVAVPAFGVIGLGGFLLAAWGAGGFGAIIGGATNFMKVRLDDVADFWCEIPIEGGDLVLAVKAGEKAAKVRGIMSSHGARCFLDHATLEEGTSGMAQGSL